ncbi:uncharacterized protein K444DRAFT_662404 [Hyaloscypha bicolor E]|uniref:Uncharacterized protein n=1 Tax=Hyaloscypha bicolor E TaxID=1095630 RepID=A0A2J6TEB7_9HELO|nr:uncharacterized protein K444DRAFT_662404 [Hyaloscypha bicolor E]PMD61298.1 hypothetical protein K444DRAFT_662404 [Hyaloscypha bicolor E]
MRTRLWNMGVSAWKGGVLVFPRERVQTQKALEWNKRRSRAVSSDREDTIEVIEAPAAPQSKRTEISSRPKERIVAAKVKALTAKAEERPASVTSTPNQLAHEKANASANAQIKVLTDLVESLVRTMEEQKEEYAPSVCTVYDVATIWDLGGPIEAVHSTRLSADWERSHRSDHRRCFLVLERAWPWLIIKLWEEGEI